MDKRRIISKEDIMKSTLTGLTKITIVCLLIAVLFGCVPPGAGRASASSAAPAGLAQAYDDAGWELLSEDNGTLAYRIPAARMPAIAVGDQVIRNGTELREVVYIVEKTADVLVVHTINGNMAKLFPANATLSIDTETMTATVEYQPAGRAVAAAYTLPVVLKQIRETQADGSEVVLYNEKDSGARSVTLIDVTNSTSIVNIDKTFTQEIFNVSGSGTKTSGNATVTYNGNANLTLQQRVKLGVNFNLRLYLNLDAGVTMVLRTSTVSWWLFGWHTSTISWYEAVPYANLNRDLKASISGNALVSATADLTCNGTVTGTYSVPLPFSLTVNFAVGVVPVEIGYTPSLAVEARAQGNLHASTGASFSLDGEWGVKCTNSGWGAINTLNTATSFTPPTLTASASLSVIPKIRNELRVGIGFANTGVYGTVAITPYLQMQVGTGLAPADRTWNVLCGVTGSAGVKASLIGYDLGAYEAQILNYSKVISSGTY
jgi:hypothetical protein